MKTLTEFQISKLPKHKKVLASKGGIRFGTGYPNLKINVRKSGAMSWVFLQRYNGKDKPIGLGSFPTVSLDDAIGETLKLKRAVHEGVVVAKHRLKKAERAMTTLEVIKIFLCRMTDDNTLDGQPIEVAPVTFNQYKKTLLERCEKIHKTPFADIDSDDLAEVIKEFWHTASADKWITQIKAFLLFGEARFNYSWDVPKLLKKVCENHMPLKEAHVEQPEGSLSIAALQDWYKRMDTDPRALKMKERDRLACKIGPLLHKRLKEIVTGKWKEIDFSDMDNVIWTIPKSRMKVNKKRLHDYQMPVPKVVAEWLLAYRQRNDIKDHEGVDDDDYIFAADPAGRNKKLGASKRNGISAEDFTGVNPIQNERVSAALHRFCPLGMGVEGYPATPHGTNRSTFQTWAEAQQDPNNPGNGKYSHDAIELQLDHTLDGGKVRRAYDRDVRWDMRKVLVEDYAKLILG